MSHFLGCLFLGSRASQHFAPVLKYENGEADVSAGPAEFVLTKF
jgi:hypothetical protein